MKIQLENFANGLAVSFQGTILCELVETEKGVAVLINGNEVKQVKKRKKKN